MLAQALRAGTIDPDSRYSFLLPESFKEARISNTQNGAVSQHGGCWECTDSKGCQNGVGTFFGQLTGGKDQPCAKWCVYWELLCSLPLSLS